VAGDSVSAHRAGETVLIVKVPEAEPAVGEWRTQFDPVAAAGIPAHITVLAPFLDRRLVDASVLGELEALVGKHQSIWSWCDAGGSRACSTWRLSRSVGFAR